MKTNKILLILALCLSVPLFAQSKKDNQIIEDAKAAKEAFINEDSTLRSFFDDSEAYVIFPNVGKGAYILGGAAGNGVLYENGSVQGFAEMTIFP